MDLFSVTVMFLFCPAKYAALWLLHEVESVFLGSPFATLFLRKGTVQVTKLDKNRMTGPQTAPGGDIHSRSDTERKEDIWVQTHSSLGYALLPSPQAPSLPAMGWA